MGRDFEAPRKLKKAMIEAGFEDVIEKQILAPVNSWPLDPKDRTIGNWVCLNGLRAAESLGKVMIVGGLPEEDAPALIQEIRHDLTNASMRVYEPRKCLPRMHKSTCQILVAEGDLQNMWSTDGNQSSRLTSRATHNVFTPATLRRSRSEGTIVQSNTCLFCHSILFIVILMASFSTTTEHGA